MRRSQTKRHESYRDGVCFKQQLKFDMKQELNGGRRVNIDAGIKHHPYILEKTYSGNRFQQRIGKHRDSVDFTVYPPSARMLDPVKKLARSRPKRSRRMRSLLPSPDGLSGRLHIVVRATKLDIRQIISMIEFKRKMIQE